MQMSFSALYHLQRIYKLLLQKTKTNILSTKLLRFDWGKKKNKTKKPKLVRRCLEYRALEWLVINITKPSCSWSWETSGEWAGGQKWPVVFSVHSLLTHPAPWLFPFLWFYNNISPNHSGATSLNQLDIHCLLLMCYNGWCCWVPCWDVCLILWEKTQVYYNRTDTS